MTETAQATIQSAVTDNPVMVFMKGSPQFPQCGFSAAVVQILNYLEVEFHSLNVLEDQDIRQGIKDFSDWPTIPQVYVKGEFVGGCDIVKEMFEQGELRPFLEGQGVLAASA